MNSRALIRWSCLEDKRRRMHTSGLQGAQPLVSAMLYGTVLAAEMTRRFLSASAQQLHAATSSASHLWVAIALCAFSIGVFGASFRLYWRRDSKLLASLPVPGTSLFSLALWRSHQVAIQLSLALLCALIPMAIWGSLAQTLRHLLILCLGFSAVAWLGPAAALAAGAIVASDKAQALLAGMSGEFQAPKNTWLSILPAAAASYAAVLILGSAKWLSGNRPPGGSIYLYLLLGIVFPLFLLLWSFSKAEKVIPNAVREVAALDQEILAHVERSAPSWLEKKAIQLGSTGRATIALGKKDASLLRRRYPSPFFLLPIGIATIWIIAASRPLSYLAWGATVYASLLLYSLILSKRTWNSPIEISQLLSTLAISRKQAEKSKASLVILRNLLIVVFAGIPLLLRAPEKMNIAILLLFTTVLFSLLSILGPSKKTPPTHLQ